MLGPRTRGLLRDVWLAALCYPSYVLGVVHQPVCTGRLGSVIPKDYHTVLVFKNPLVISSGSVDLAPESDINLRTLTVTSPYSNASEHTHRFLCCYSQREKTNLWSPRGPRHSIAVTCMCVRGVYSSIQLVGVSC